MTQTLQFAGNTQAVLDEMGAICDWLTANGITPGRVPLDARVTIDHGQLTVEVYRTRPDGSLHLDETAKDVVRDAVTVPLVQEPPKLASLRPVQQKGR